MTIISDATSLILLAKVSILEIFLKRNHVITSATVYKETIRGKEKGRGDSILIEKQFHENKLKIKTPKKSVKDNIVRLFNLKAGELEVVSLAYNSKDAILSDDKKCLSAAKALGIGFINSLDVAVELYKKKAISKEKALQCIEGFEEFGWYSKELIKIYKEEIK